MALLIEALLLLAFLSLGPPEQPGKKEDRLTTVSLDPYEVPEEAPEPSSPEPEQKAEEQPSPEQPATEEPPPPTPADPQPPRPVQPPPVPIARPVIPEPLQQPSQVTTPQPPAKPAPPARRAYGPPDTGSPTASSDTERVGTAPNGEPLYAAAWYRKPKPEQLRGYLSTASGPGWGLIACRTVADYRVEDCVGLDEYPQGSQINRAVLAAAWEFRVRPPFLGGRPLVGSWVRIRIDYGLERR